MGKILANHVSSEQLKSRIYRTITKAKMDLKNKQKTWGGAFLPGKYTNGQQTCEKMFNTTDHCMKISVAEKYHFTPIRRATQINKQKRTRLGAGERPLWFRTLAALPEYQSLVPKPH